MRFDLRLDPTSAVPLWHQIELGLKRLVNGGALRTGAQVPSVRDLARELRVNPATVVKACPGAHRGRPPGGATGRRDVRARGPRPRPDDTARRPPLREAAGHYAGLALGLGAPLEEAVLELRSAWPHSSRAAERRNE